MNNEKTGKIRLFWKGISSKVTCFNRWIQCQLDTAIQRSVFYSGISLQTSGKKRKEILVVIYFHHMFMI